MPRPHRDALAHIARKSNFRCDERQPPMPTGRAVSPNAQRQRAYRERERERDPEGFRRRTASYKRELRARRAERNVAKDGDAADAAATRVRSTARRPTPRPTSDERTHSKPTEPPERRRAPTPERHRARETSVRVRPPTPPPPERGTVDPIHASSCGDVEAQIRRRRDQMRARDPEARLPTDGTIATQFSRIKLLYRHMYGREFACRDFEWTRDTARVLAFIDSNERWQTDSTRNCHRTALAAILRNLEGFEDVARAYGHEVSAANRVIHQQIGENSLRGTQRRNYMTWEELVRRISQIPRGTMDSALTAIYTYAPPRRLLDYALMRVTRAAEPERLDTTYNYMAIDAHRAPTRFVFNRYKTATSTGQQIIEASSFGQQANQILKEYIVAARLVEGDLLFGDHGRPHTNFSRLVSTTFERWTGKGVSVDLLRHAFITHALSLRPTLNERAELARVMGHSVRTQAEYEVIDQTLEPRVRS